MAYHRAPPGQHLLQVLVPLDVVRSLRAIAEPEERTLSSEVRLALRRHLARSGGTAPATDDKGGADHASSGTAARGGAARDVCEPA